jgi:hypothetical protein
MGKNRLAIRSDLIGRRMALLSESERCAVAEDLAAPPGGIGGAQAALVRAASAGRLRPVELDWADSVLADWSRADLAARLVVFLALR